MRVACNALRIAVTIGFLANSNSDLVEYDVLAKFRNDFEKGTPERRAQIIEKSKKRGKNGYNVGNDLMFLGSRGFQNRPASELTGRELEYAHIRDGHPHAVRYGKGKELVKIMWFQPTVVRPDLPFKQEE